MVDPVRKGKTVDNQKQQKKFYTPEFKAEAVALCKKVGVTKASQDLQVSLASLDRWRRDSDGVDTNSGASKLSYEALEKENQRLKKELQYIEEINKVLKKSTAIFSSSHLGGLK